MHQHCFVAFVPKSQNTALFVPKFGFHAMSKNVNFRQEYTPHFIALCNLCINTFYTCCSVFPNIYVYVIHGLVSCRKRGSDAAAGVWVDPQLPRRPCILITSLPTVNKASLNPNLLAPQGLQVFKCRANTKSPLLHLGFLPFLASVAVKAKHK